MGNQLKRQQSSVSGKRLVSKSASSKVFTNNFLAVAKQNEYILEQKMKGNRRRIDPRVALNHQFEEIYKVVEISFSRFLLYQNHCFDDFLDARCLGIDASDRVSVLPASGAQTRMSQLLFRYR